MNSKWTKSIFKIIFQYLLGNNSRQDKMENAVPAQGAWSLHKEDKHSRNKNASWEGDIINEIVTRLLSCCNYQVFWILQQRLMTHGEGGRPGAHTLRVVGRTEMECKTLICCSASFCKQKAASKTSLFAKHCNSF